jgi:hypothetical protein
MTLPAWPGHIQTTDSEQHQGHLTAWVWYALHSIVWLGLAGEQTSLVPRGSLPKS